MLVTKELLRCLLVRSTNLQAFRQTAYIALLLAGLCLAAVPARAQVSGQNVNMVSGTNWTNGDPFLQRQNEPSIAVSSRNSSHLLAGANDYRTVDLPGVLGIDERGDAWLGLFKSFDGGRTWQSTLLPGFPLDGSPQGQASPIHGFQAASDPTVRAGTNGLFYYTGLAFNRVGNLPRSAVFVSRFVDLNNKENGDATFESGSITNLQPRDTVKYIDTTVVDSGGIPGTPGASTFLDKPWVAVDIPRSGATCTISVEEDGKIITQTIPAAPVYVTYTSFVGNGPVQFSNINFRRSLDCGATWSSPTILSKNDEPSGDAEHQGTVIAIDPSVPSSEPATVYVAWRRFASATDPDAPPAIFLAKSADGGAHWGTAFPIVVFPSSCISKPTGVGCPFDQVFTNTSFRSNGYPALTVDSFGRVYVAWSQRDANGDGKIMMGIAPGGRSIQSASIAPVDIGSVADDDGNAFSNLSGHGSQLMPSLSFEAGKLVLAYYDLRQDHTTGTFVQKPDPNCDSLVTLPCVLGGQYLESRALEGEISPPNPPNNPAVFSTYIADSAPPLTVRRHTIDVMGAEAVPPPTSSLQAPSFKTFRITHYLFGSIPHLFQDVEQIQFNAPNLPLFVDGTAPFMGDYIDVSGTPQIIADGNGGWTFNTSPTANPVFHAAWTDNRDVVPPADGNWQNYTPPISDSNPGGQPSKFDPTKQPLTCVVGQTGMRNQNVYTAEISQGVVLTSPQTSKPVLTPAGQPIQRAFVVELRNASNAARSFQVDIPTQPATAAASFSQFSSMTAQTVKVNAFSSQSFPVFVVANTGSTIPFPTVLVRAVENDAANPPLTGSVLLNPDPTNPALTNPDNAAIGANQISVNEFYNPGVANPGVANSGVPNPGVANPGVANPGVANPGVANPTVVVALNPGVANPGVANPGVANPGVANPGVANESVTDASYTFTNEGNTSAAYTIQFFQSAPFPAGAKFQIILSKVYFTEQAVGCQIQQVGTNVIVANVTNPVFVTDPTQLGNPGVANLSVQTPTINLAPGDSGQITIRTNLSVAQVVSEVLPNVSPVAVSQAVNTVDVKNGIFTPPINLLVTSTSASLPVGVTGQLYNTSLTSVGGNTGARNWVIASGSLPPGLQLNAASGAITGTPTQAGSFAFTAQVMDTGATQHTATRALTITIVPPVAITTPSPALPEGGSGSPYTQTFIATGGIPPYTWSNTGTLPPGLTLGKGGVLTGTPTAGGTYNFTVKTTDTLGLVASAAYTVLITNAAPAGAQIQFITQPTTTTAGQAISPAVRVQIVDATGAAIPGLTVTLGAGSGVNRPILSGTLSALTDASGVATFSNVVVDRAGTGFALIAAPAGVSSSGAVHPIQTPPSVQLGALESDTQIQFFGERLGVSLSSSVGVDISGPGSYSSVAGLSTGSISAGTIVDSYYLHADPVGFSNNVGQLEAGGVTFPTDVLGVIVLDPSLTASDPAVGALGTSYPNGVRALELGSPTDTAILSADRRTVTLHLSNSSASDDVRVITAANPNASLGPVTSAPFNSLAAAGSISTVAGSTWVFPGGGPATNVPLGLGADFIGERVGVVADRLGNVYVADPNNHMVFKISGGTLSVVAGTGVEGYFGDGGLATAARLDFPTAVALSVTGELYISDTNNSVIRKVDSSGKITTVVGVGFPGYFGDGGPAINGGLSFPEGIAFDSGGNLLIADTSNAVIRKVDTSGVITTLPITTQPPNFRGLCLPEDVAAGAAGTVYIADSCLNQVFNLTGGSLAVVAGNGTPGYFGDGGAATNASLSTPIGITFDGAGNLYIADEGNNVVRKVDTAGIITTVVGTGGFGFAGDGGPALLSLMAQPGAVAFDASGNLYIGDTSSERIRKVDNSGTITTIAGNGRFKYAGDGGQATSASLDNPTGTAVDPSGNLFATDIANLVVRKISPSGVISTYAGTSIPAPSYTGDGGPATAASLFFTNDVQADNAGNIYVTEGGRVHKISSSGIITTLLTVGSQNNGVGTGNSHVALDRQGNVYVTDTFGSRVLKLDTTGAVTVIAGTGTQGFSGDGGPATLATLRVPRGLVVDSAGNLYVADTGNQRVRRVDTTGTITTVAGNGPGIDSGDGGPATSAGLPGPFALAVDGAGNLFIGSADRVRMVSAIGTITTIVGGGFFEPTVDGIPATNAVLGSVQGLAFDAAGNLYVSDRNSDRVRKITGVTTTPPLIFTPPTGLTVTTQGLPHGDVGVPYSQTLSAVGGTSLYTWTLASGALPAGLSLSSAGLISGTPTATGALTFAVQAKDSAGATATQSLTITIDVALTISTTSLPVATLGVAYSQTLSFTGGTPPVTWRVAAGSFPPGMSLNSSTGLISGGATVAGTFSFTLQATDNAIPARIALRSYTINVVRAGQAANVAFVTQPANSVGGQALAGSPVVVQVNDSTGASIAGASVTIAFNGTPPCSAAVLSGTLTQTTNALGQASFPNLIVDRGQNNYTLAATAGSINAVSNPFNVTGFCATASMSTPRELHTEVLLGNGKVLIAGGVSNTSSLSSAEIYDPIANTVSPTGNLTAPNGRAAHASVLLPNGQVLLLGGADNAGNSLATAELYDPASGTFFATGSMVQPRDWARAVLLANGRVLVAGGVNANGQLNTAEIYDPATGLFTSTGNLNQSRSRQVMTLLPNGKVLIAGGRTFGGSSVNVFASAEIFDPNANNGTGAFTAIGNMNSPRDEARASLLSSGKVLIVGGFVSYVTGLSASSAEIFDPATNAFVLTGSMSAPRAHPTASLLLDGRVLVTGGVPDTGNTTPAEQTAEIYSPTTGTFSLTGALTMGREYAETVILPTGNPLVSGGDDGINATATQEIYYSNAPQATIAITTTTLAPAATGQPFTQVLLEQGGVGTLTWSETGSIPLGINFSAQGVLNGTPTVAGSFPLTITLTDSSTPAKTTSSSFILSVANTPLVFTSSTVPTAVVGRPYTQTLPVVGGTQPYNGTVTSGTLPPGMAVVGNMLTGTPTGSGNFAFTVSVTDSSSPTQTATQALTISVNTLVITTSALPSGIVGVSYNAAINTAGGTPPFSFSLANTAFPPGLLIQQPPPGSSSGALAGTPTQAGTFNFSESVVDSSNPQQTATQNYVITIAPAGSAVPANVAFVSGPQNSVGGKTLSGGPIMVRVTDAANNPVPQTTVAMTLMSIFNGPVPCSVATLSGTLSAVTDSTGQTTFSNLSIDRGGYNYALLASTGSASGSSGPFSVQGFCGSGSMSTQREGHTQDVLGTSFTRKFALDPAGSYLFANTNPGPGGIPDNPHPPLIITLGQFGVKPGDIISGIPVGDADVCGVGQFCSGELFLPFTCAVFSSSNTLLGPSSGLNRVPGAIAPDFTTAFPCNTGNTAFGNLPTDIPQDFALLGERVTVPPGAQYLFVALSDIFYADNLDQNGDYGVAFTLNSTTSVNSKVLIAGGADNNGNALNTAELYDPALGFTQPTGNLTEVNGRADHVSVVLPDGRVLLTGGDNNTSILATAELYDPSTGTFASTGRMSQARAVSAAVLLADGRVLVSGGATGIAVLDTAEIYDPNTGIFTPTGNMNQPRTRHTMTLLPNGKVLVTGGRDAAVNFFALASAEIFDPFANGGVGAFTPVANMNSPRFKHTSTLLANGSVLIAGGFNGNASSLSVASAEIFDPKTNTFAPTGSMNTPRARHTATALPDGTVLLAGGINSFNGLLAAAPAEIYSPASGTFSPTGSLITGRELPAASLLLPNGNVLLSGGDNGVDELPSTEVYFNTVPQAPIVITTTSVPNGVISQPYVQLLLSQNKAAPIFWSLASGTLPPGINLIVDGVLFGAPTVVGSFTFTLQVTDGISTATATYTVNVSLSTLAFTSNTLPTAGAGKPYSQPLPVTGGKLPYSAGITGGTLPLGLALGSTGVLSGTPTSAGSFTFTVSVTDSSAPAQTATQTLTIAIDTLSITTTALPSGIVGVPYGAAISTSGGTLPLSFSAADATFPAGLVIQQPAANSQGGALAGTPTQAGHYTFTERVSDSSSPTQTATQYYTMDIFAVGSTAAPAHVTFIRQPQNSVGGQILAGSPIGVSVTDSSNAPIGGASVAISFNGTPRCSTAVLSGTLNLDTNGNGNAFFSDLSIDRGQLGYTLLASSGSASAISQPFTVNGFCPTGNLSVGRRYATATLLSNGKVLVAGGDNPGGGSGSVSSELFDPASGSFTPSGTMSTARAGHKATLLNTGHVLVTGGRGPVNGIATAELYDPASAVFTLTASMNAARLEHSSMLLADGGVLIVGGFTGLLGTTAVYSSGIELYDPATGAFSLTGSLNVPRAFHTATLLPNGKVLIAGGSNSSGPLASVEIYDPVAGTSSLVGNMNTPRNLHTATLLPNGQVLLAGGQGTGLIALSSAELFDPSTGTFTPTGSMLSSSVDSRARLLADGTVLVSTGFTFPNTISEIYNPGSGTFSQTGPLVQGHRGNGATLLGSGQVLIEGGEDPKSNGTLILNSAEIYYTASSQASAASIKLNFFPNTVYNANTAAMDAALGTTGYIIDSFETTALTPGLTIQLSGGVPTTTWTSLPNLFDGDICPGLTSGEAWDGTDAASNQISNQVTNCASALGSANVITFNYAPGATSFGVGLSNFQSVNPASPSFPITNHELFVNGVDMGVLETLAGAAWSSGLTRNVYLRIDATSGGVITSVGIENLSGVDFLMFDHLAILP